MSTLSSMLNLEKMRLETAPVIACLAECRERFINKINLINQTEDLAEKRVLASDLVSDVKSDSDAQKAIASLSQESLERASEQIKLYEISKKGILDTMNELLYETSKNQALKEGN